MDWVKLVIPLIALAVWIISHILSTQQGPPARRQGPRPTPPPPRDAEQERSDRDFEAEERRHELDRRIAEARARRRRKEQEEDYSAAPSPAPPPLPRPATPPPIVSAGPPQRKPAEALRRSPSTLVPQPRPDAIPTVVPELTLPKAGLPKAALPKAALPKAGLPQVSLPGIEVPKVVPSTPAVAAAMEMMEEAQELRARSGPAARVLELVRDRDSLAAAFLLKEIFDRPAERRRPPG